MQQILFYSLVSAFLWGVMATVESVARQYQMHTTLLVKSLMYGIVGSALVLYLRGLSTVQSNIITFARDRPKLLALLCAGVTAGVFGTYFLYCAFDSCGDNKAPAVIIS
jgi:drug/metabolite transporter (DMT)-like permease